MGTRNRPKQVSQKINPDVIFLVIIHIIIWVFQSRYFLADLLKIILGGKK